MRQKYTIISAYDSENLPYKALIPAKNYHIHMNNPLSFNDEHTDHLSRPALTLFNATALLLALFCVANAF